MMPMLKPVPPKASTSRKRPERRAFTPSVKYGAQKSAVARKEAPINAKAIATLNLITATREAVARLSSPAESPRAGLSLALTLTSLDHGASAAQLIGLNASVHGASIATLFRAQLETFVRAVFFGSPSGATDYEVEQFISQDKLPRRPERENRKDKAESTYKRKRLDEMTFAMFGDFAAAILDPRNPNGPAMAQMLKFDERNIHGLVQGASILYRMYKQTDDPTVVATDKTYSELLRRSGALAMFSLKHVRTQLGIVQPRKDDDFMRAITAYFGTFGLST
jgi:hypothetical protein